VPIRIKHLRHARLLLVVNPVNTSRVKPRGR
jgi:hypothetical protein